ncbi:MAG: hypothetical protein QNJ84_18980 [Alphaproteobacteria bacterium]|nr:hypothetical protein [Alphaproteobacteria bacterium]
MNDQTNSTPEEDIAVGVSGDRAQTAPDVGGHDASRPAVAEDKPGIDALLAANRRVALRGALLDAISVMIEELSAQADFVETPVGELIDRYRDGLEKRSAALFDSLSADERIALDSDLHADGPQAEEIWRPQDAEKFEEEAEAGEEDLVAIHGEAVRAATQAAIEKTARRSILYVSQRPDMFFPALTELRGELTPYPDLLGPKAFDGFMNRIVGDMVRAAALGFVKRRDYAGAMALVRGEAVDPETRLKIGFDSVLAKPQRDALEASIAQAAQSAMDAWFTEKEQQERTSEAALSARRQDLFDAFLDRILAPDEGTDISAVQTVVSTLGAPSLDAPQAPGIGAGNAPPETSETAAPTVTPGEIAEAAGAGALSPEQADLLMGLALATAAREDAPRAVFALEDAYRRHRLDLGMALRAAASGLITLTAAASYRARLSAPRRVVEREWADRISRALGDPGEAMTVLDEAAESRIGEALNTYYGKLLKDESPRQAAEAIIALYGAHEPTPERPTNLTEPAAL